jgi:HlyD family secretion protein
LAAERDDAEAVGTPKELAGSAGDADVQEALASERKLFELRRTARLGQKQQLRQRIAQLQEEIRGLEAQQGAKTKEAELIEQELVGMRELRTLSQSTS